MTLFDSVESANEPRYHEGDDIYRVVLDVVEHCQVFSSFSLGVDIFGEHTEAGQTLWRYHLVGVDRNIGGVFGEYEMGTRWFDSLLDAQMQATRNRAMIEAAGMVIRAKTLMPLESVAYTTKAPNGHLMSCQAARLSKCAVFEKKPYCYSFIRIFETEKEAEQRFKKLSAELKAEGWMPAEFAARDMYKVNDTLWSCEEYVERHGRWDVLKRMSKRGHYEDRPMPLAGTPRVQEDRDRERQ
jgi:hypothetical protein